MVVNRRFCCLQYDCSLTPTKNIGLPDSLLSKFDLLFIVLDQMDADINCQISEHVLCMHHYHTPGEDAGMLLSSFFTIQKRYYNVIQVIAFTLSSVVADIVSLGGSLQFPLSNGIACIISMLRDI
jgi:hypothetical protein